MRRAAFAVALLLASGCAALRPGPTKAGVAVRVSTREKAAARREALESALPFFLDPAARREKSAALEAVVFSQPGPFIGRSRLPKKGACVVEVRLDRLSAALQRAGLVRPPGYAYGPELLLIAFGDRKTGPDGTERFAADVFETALFGRGIQAKDADDDLIKLKHPLKAKTEEGAAVEALSEGWSWMTAGRVAVSAAQEPQTALWRGRARLSVALYGVAGSTAPTRLDADGEAVDVSSNPAVARAIEDAAQQAAQLVDADMARRHAGRAIVAVFVSGYKDPAYLSRVLRDLRGVPGVEGAALVGWRDLDDMALVHAYVDGLHADLLTARLLRGDASLRVGSVESEDGRIQLDGPEASAAQDRGD
ncbi:MAG: hypothetical protein KGJ84_02385 [Elusimicrobia bacterium]|nr:hypothetical protein [Elusimicrobiota bacterium]